MHGKQFSRLRVQFDLLVNTDIDLRKVVLVEVTLQYLTILQDALLLQLALRTEHEPSGIQLLVLCIDGLGLLLALGLQVLDVGVLISDGLVELRDMDILSIQLCTQLLQCLITLLQLLGQVDDGLLELITLHRALTHLLLQFLDQLTVLSHAL